jgi:multiple sugar transport system permease protein
MTGSAIEHAASGRTLSGPVAAGGEPAQRAPSLAGFLDSTAAMPTSVALALAFLLVFAGYPIAYNVLLSLQEVNLGNLRTPFDRPFVGLDNFREVVGDPVFPRIVAQTLLFVAGNVGLSFALGLALALFFDLGFPGASVFRGLILGAWFLPPMVIGAVFKWIYASEYGVLNAALLGFGLIDGPVHYLADPDNALLAVTLANVWFGTPFVMILLAAGISALPAELYEAAALDGAGRVRRFRYVTWPQLRATVFAVLALSTIYTMRVFDLVWSMTRGGPADATNILPLWSYLFSFEMFRFGPGAAVSVILLCAVFLVAGLYVRSLRDERQA